MSYTNSSNNFESSFGGSNPVIDDGIYRTSLYQPYESSLKTEAARSGAHNYAVICVNFTDYGNPRWTKAEVEDMMQTIDDYWFNASYGTMWIDYEVEGWFTLPNNLAHYGSVNGDGVLSLTNWRDVVQDAVDVADPFINFNTYDYVIVLLAEAWWRGFSTLGVPIEITTDEVTKDVEGTLVGERTPEDINAVWGRIAHEMGHCFLLRHTNGSGGTQKNYASYYSLMARGYPSALTVYSQVIDEHAGWFNEVTNQDTVLPGETKTRLVRPRHLDVSGHIQCLKVPISATLYYRVEVCEQEDEDQWLPDEGVFIYIVDEGANINDQCTDQDSTPGSIVHATDPARDLQDCLYDVGDTFTDVANGITIDIDSQTAFGYDITVVNAAGSTADLMINPWGDPPGHPGPWESIDIYCDSPINGYGWYVEGGATPTGNGDPPLLNQENMLRAKVHNIGDLDALDVTVSFYENVPIGVGDAGTFDFIDQVTGLTVLAGQTVEVSVPWTPEADVEPTDEDVIDMHSCVRVIIDDHPSEDNHGNNAAQENINSFDVTFANTNPYDYYPEADYGSITKSFRVTNPYKESKQVYINLVDITPGWTVSGNGLTGWHNYGSNEAREYTITITPGPDVRMTETVEAHLIAGTFVGPPYDNDTFMGDLHLEPFGGLTLTATTKYRSDLEVMASIRDENNFQIMGTLSFPDDPPQQHQPEADGDKTVFVIIENEDTGEKYNGTDVIDINGEFKVEFAVKTGTYSANAYYSGTHNIAKSVSVTLMVNLLNNTWWTSTRTGLFPGFTFYVTFGAVFVACLVIYVKRKKR
ncbi:MAG: hypothetical protein FK733_13970 [Asgard group archaeon]|nr:hypothetical protein [Asgard group archaeon]